jgi:hypothetical protein
MSELDPRRRKIALLAIAICTLNMPFMLLMKHAQGSRYFPLFIIFYVLAMVVLTACVILEFVKYKRSAR